MMTSQRHHLTVYDGNQAALNGNTSQSRCGGDGVEIGIVSLFSDRYIISLFLRLHTPCPPSPRPQ